MNELKAEPIFIIKKLKSPWKDEKNYPRVKGTTWHRWAQEFLMRNWEFHDQLLEAIKFDESQPKQVAWSKSAYGKVLKKWGVDRPNIKSWDHLFDSPFRFVTYPVLMSSGKFPNGTCITFAEQDDNKLCLEFDLSKPISPQISRAKKILELNQESRLKAGEKIKRRNNEQAEMMPRYLRLLDSQLENVSLSELAEFFNEGIDTIMAQLSKAESLRDGGYIELLEK